MLQNKTWDVREAWLPAGQGMEGGTNVSFSFQPGTLLGKNTIFFHGMAPVTLATTRCTNSTWGFLVFLVF